MRRIIFISLVTMITAAVPLHADVELILKNGQMIKGVDVTKEPDRYRLEEYSGRILSVPEALVEEMRFTGGRQNTTGRTTRRDESERQEHFGVVENEPGTAGGPAIPADTFGMEADAKPQAVDGRGEGDIPNPADEVETQDLTHGHKQRGWEWTPEGDWGQNNDWVESSTNDSNWNFQPSQTWEPESSLQEDSSNFNPSQWVETPNNWAAPKTSSGNPWAPTDAFKKDTSLEVAAGTEAVPTSEAGVASWYGEPFQGKTTASGAPYDMNAFTAAHPSLPFGTMVLVTNLSNGRNTLLEITDRGPSVEGRAINLSYATASELRMVEQGLAEVQIEVLSGQKKGPG